MHSAQNGSSIHIKGEFSASEDVTIAGRIEGAVNIEGHVLTIVAGGEVAGDITAAGIVVRGTVKGTLVADDRIEIRETAVAEGEFSAPRIAIADGAEVRARIDMPAASKRLSLAS